MPTHRPTPPASLGRILLILAQVLVALGLPLSGSQTTTQAAGTITGTVFQDFNANGARDTAATIPNNGSGTAPVAVDRGVGGVVVTAYDSAGLAVGSTASLADGTYSLSASGTGPYRIEFTNLPAGYQPGPRGANNGTTVRFVPDGNSANIDLGLNRPGDYCQDNPLLVTNCYVFGDQLTGTNALSATIISFPYSAGSNSPTVEADYDQPTTHATTIAANQVGVTWGLAYARATQRLYAGAYMKKHSGFGPGGPGAVYVINPIGNTVAATFSVPNAISNTHNTADYQTDNGNLSWNAIGKTSLGGLDLSDDESRLFVMNLEERALYALNATTGAVIVSATVPLNPPVPSGACPAGDVRPFAVEYHNGQVFIGMVCSAESNQALANLQAYVYTATTSLAFSAAPVVQIPMTYTRGLGNSGPTGQVAAWNPWAPSLTTLPANFGDPNGAFPVYPQPMLTSIAFDANGDMVLAFRDRFGDQMGNAAPSDPGNPANLYFGVTAGDTLRACVAGGVWTLEDNGRCGGNGNAPQGTGQGLGGGEFYFTDDFSTPANGGNYHDEVSLGSVTQLPGFPDVVATMFDPIPRSVGNNAVFDGGTRWLNNITGDLTKAYRVFNGSQGDPVFFGKANGLGDLIALCDAAPIELGNRVWTDTDSDGVQDPGEAALGGLIVGLFSAGPDGNFGTGDDIQVAATTTDLTTGEYYFNDGTDGNPDRDLLPNTAYQIRIDLTQGALANQTLAVRDGDTTPNGDSRDSDAARIGGNAVIDVTTGGAGVNDHTLDFGFVTAVSIGNQVWNDSDNSGTINGAEPGLPGITTQLFFDANRNGVLDGNEATTPITSTATITNGLYLFNNLAPGNYEVCLAGSNFNTGGALVGFTSSTGGGGEPAPDPDADADDGDDNGSVVGTLGSGGMICSTLVTLAPGSEPTAENPNNDPGTPDNSSNLTVDFGVTQAAPIIPLSLGNQVWYDTDNDGVRDATEPGVLNVRVELWQDDGDGVFEPGAGDTNAGFRNTDANGLYLFTNLVAGGYFVAIPQSQCDSGGPLFGYNTSTGAGAAAGPNEPAPDPDNDLDNRDDGSRVTGQCAVSGALTLAATTEPAGEDPNNDPTTPDNNSNLTVDFGFYQLSVGNIVWIDGNNDCALNAGETGISAVTVNLYRDDNGDGAPDGAAIATTTTNATGNYAFTGLTPGNYLVEVVPPAGYVTSTGANGSPTGPCESAPDPDDDLDSRDDGTGVGASIRTSTLTLLPGTEPSVTNATATTNNPTIDFGLFQPAALGDRVWIDANGNGVQDGGEAGVPNVTVTLFNSSGTPIGTTTTNATGVYGFTNLIPGDYSVGFAPTTGYTFTVQDAGGNDTTDSDANPTTGRTITTNLIAGETDPTWDAGLIPLLCLGNLVWRDANNNGRVDAGETGIAGVTVELYRDTNGNGSYDAGVDVLLGTTTTSGSGNYLFCGLRPDNYLVVLPASNFGGVLSGFTTSTGNASEPAPDPDDDVNDDDNGTTVTTVVASAAVTLSSNTEPTSDGDADPNTNLTVDFGVFQLAALGDRVWLDLNNDGVQTPGEPGVAGVTVRLYNGVGTVLSTTTTDPSGFYGFTNLTPGDYFVEFVLPVNHQFTTPDLGGDDALDSDADTVTGRTIVTTLTPGETDPTWDAGLIVPPATIGNYVWEDVDRDGLQDPGEPPVPNVTVSLLDNLGNVISITTTDAGGLYLFTGLAPADYAVQFVPPAGYVVTTRDAGADDAVDSDPDPATGRTINTTLSAGEIDLTWDAGLFRPVSIGDRVWVDTNGNGVQEGGEVGLNGVTVRLLDGGGNVLSTTVTAGDGNYLFTTLPGGASLPPGAYQVEFVLPPGNTFTGNDQGGDDATDSDANPATGRSPLITLPSGTSNLTVDAGVIPLASLGDRVWLDSNANGVQDGGETGIANVTVQLFNASGALLASTTTNGSGNYLFANLRPGDYFVQFTPPAGLIVTGQDQGADDATDSDANRTTGRTVVTALTAGENDLTWDAGLYPPGALGQYVWLDDDRDGVQDPNENGVPGVTVRLRDPGPDGQPCTPDDVVLSTQTTNGTGFFLFPGLPAGNYGIEVTLPPGYSFTGQDVGGNDNGDSDVSVTTGCTAAIVLGVGQTNLTIAAGIINQPTAVELLYFRVERVEGATVTLGWATAAEVDNFGFYVYRAPVDDFTRSQGVGFVNAGSPSGATYSFADTVPSTGTWFYWLADLDHHGNATLHGPVSTAPGATSTGNKLYLPLVTR